MSVERAWRGLALVLALAVATAPWPVRAQDEPVILSGHFGALDAAAFSPDGQHVLTGSADRFAQLWELSGPRSLLILEGHEHRVTGVAFGPDGTLAVTAGADGTARLWDLASGTETLRFERPGERFNDVAFSRNGRHVAIAGNDGRARLWDIEEDREVRVFEGHEDAITSLALSPDGRRLVTGSTDRTARLWDVVTGNEIRRFEGHDTLILSIAFDPGGGRVVTGSWDGTARLWDVANGEEILRIPGHGSPIRSVAFNPDGTVVATGNWDRTARLWNAETGEEVRAYEGHTASIDTVAFSPDGRTLLTASWDSTAGLWPVPEDLWPDLRETPEDAAPAPLLVQKAPEAVQRPDTLVLIIGNRTYTEAPPVAYAHNDAEAFAAYFRDVLGVPEDNIIVEKDLNSIEMARYFGTEDVPEGRLARRARFVDEIIVVYSGHGVPVFREEGLPSGYLLPVDVPAAEPGFGAYPLDLLIRQLEDLPVQRVTVLLDACFSGLSNRGSLVPGVSGAFGVAVAPPQEKAKVSVLTATDFRSPQFAHWLDDEKHGAFTFFALEGLRGAADGDGDGRIHLTELRDFVDEKLAQRDFRQTPSLLPGGQDSVITEFSRDE